VPARTLDATALADLDARAQRALDEGELPSLSYALALDGEVVYAAAVGDARTETRYCIFSCTKPIVAAAIWQLLGKGAVTLETRVGDVIPEFEANGKAAVTLEQLLCHTCGFPRAPLGPELWHDRAGRVARMASWRLTSEPGSAFEYHPTSAHWVLAEVIERFRGEDWRDALHRRVTAPLGLRRLVGVPPDEQGGIADGKACGAEPEGEELATLGGPAVVELLRSAEINEGTMLRFNDRQSRSAGVPGAGGIATASELAMFYQALLRNPDELWDGAVLADATTNVRVHLPDALRGVAANRTIGLVVAGDDGGASRRGFGGMNSPAAFGHEGVGGQTAWADPVTGLSFALLTNGLDRNPIRSARLVYAMSTLAGKCIA